MIGEGCLHVNLPCRHPSCCLSIPSPPIRFALSLIFVRRVPACGRFPVGPFRPAVPPEERQPLRPNRLPVTVTTSRWQRGDRESYVPKLITGRRGNPSVVSRRH